MKKAVSEPRTGCAYHRHTNYYNHAGHLPCGDCTPCRRERDALERWKRWNAVTDAGAKVNR